jgi:hypothetical protein
MEATTTADVRTALEKWARDFEPRLLDGGGAMRALRQVAKMKAICASVETRLARRVEESNAWRREGHKTPAHLVARLTATSLRDADTLLRTGQQLEQLPDTAEAFLRGRVSEQQVTEIAPAASVSPEHERELLDVARDRNHAELREVARRVTAGATDEQERHRRAHAARQLRTWTDPSGTWHLHANGTPTDGARIMARLQPETEKVFADARTAGRREPLDAYRFDALLRMAEAGPGAAAAKTRAHVLVNVDAAALERGTREPGERCEIKGVGSVPVATARDLMGDALLTILVKRGVDVTTIAHDGTKTMPASVRRAVLARDTECVVDICSAPTAEVHHLKRRSAGGEHSTQNCRGLCRWCHQLVHYHGYTLEPNGDGTYQLRAPPDP